MPEIYLDNHSGTKPYPHLIDRLALLYKEHYAHSGSFHIKGQNQSFLYAHALDSMRAAIGVASDDQCIFCEDPSLPISEVLFDLVKKSGKNHFLSTQIEENSLLQGLKNLEKFACTTRYLPLNTFGQVSKDALEASIGPKTSFLSLSWANPLTGVIQPVQELAEVCKEKGIVFHVDASYVIGKLYFRFQDTSINYLSFKGSSFHAPKGSGALFIKGKAPLVAPKNDTNLPLLATFSESLLESMNQFEHLCTETARLRDLFEKLIKDAISEVEVLFTKAERLPNTSVIAFPGIISEALLYMLNKKGVYATNGGVFSPPLSYILKSLRFDSLIADSALSFSLSYETTEADVIEAAKIIIATAKKLRMYSGQIL